MDAVPKEINSMYIFKNEMIYLYCEQNQMFKIIAINLKMYDYFQMNTKEIIKNLRERTSKCFDDPEGSIYQSYYKILPNFALLKRYLITILSN
jgi:hypothetical protein